MTPTSYPTGAVADLEKRSSYTPRRVREQRAYRLVVGGATAGAVAVIGIILAAVGLIGPDLPVIAVIVAVLCAVAFRRTVS